MARGNLPDHAVDLLAQVASRSVDPSAARTADDLFDLVVGRLRRVRRVAVFDVFEADPNSPMRRQALVDLIEEQFRLDPRFRDQVAELLGPVAEEPPPPRPAGRGVPLVAAVLAGAGLLVGAVALFLTSAGDPPPDGRTPCGQFWALPEPQQRDLLRRAFRSRGEPLRAEEPYAVAAVLYACGQDPERTVDQVIEPAGQPPGSTGRR